MNTTIPMPKTASGGAPSVGGMPASGSSCGKVLYITSETPFGPGEVWALDEMLTMLAAGVDLWVAPRSSSGEVFHSKAEPVIEKSLRVPLFDQRVALTFAKFVLLHPGRFAGSLRWARKKSVNWREFLKSAAVLPKAAELARLLRAEGIEHIHAHSTTTVAVLARELAQRLGCPYSVTMHSGSPLHDLNIPPEAIRRQFTALADSAEFVRTISAEIATRLLGVIGEEYTHKVRVVPLGVDCDVTRALAAKKERFTLLTPAVLMTHKGHAVAVEACKILRDRGTHGFRWIFCGEGPLRGQIERQIGELGLADFIQLWGNVENERIIEMYATGAVDATILPSVAVNGFHEGVPHALMQAMSYRIPVISTDSGGTMQLIGDGAGVYVPQKDPTRLADAIFRLMSDKEWCRRQGEDGYKKVAKAFNKAETVRTLSQLFSQKNQ